MSQAQLGELCGNSGRTIQAVELGKLALSEALALRIAQATGVSVEWLLDGDPKEPATADCPSGYFSTDAAYTYEVFEAHRAALESEKGAVGGHGRLNTIEQIAGAQIHDESSNSRDRALIEHVTAVLERTRAYDEGSVIRWRLKRFLDELDTQYPVSVAQRSAKRNHSSQRT